MHTNWITRVSAWWIFVYTHRCNTTLTFDLQFTGILTCFRVRPITILWFNIALPNLAHASITIRWFEEYIHNPGSTLTSDFKVKFILSCRVFCLLWYWHIIFGTWDYHHECILMSRTFMIPIQGQTYKGYIMALCSGHSFFVLSHSHTMFGMWDYHHGTICCVHSWPLTSISKLYFLHEFESSKIVFALWNGHTKFSHIPVSPWDNMLCTFFTFVWPWPLTYMWVARGILSGFYS